MADSNPSEYERVDQKSGDEDPEEAETNFDEKVDDQLPQVDAQPSDDQKVDEPSQNPQQAAPVENVLDEASDVPSLKDLALDDRIAVQPSENPEQTAAETADVAQKNSSLELASSSQAASSSNPASDQLRPPVSGPPAGIGPKSSRKSSRRYQWDEIVHTTKGFWSQFNMGGGVSGESYRGWFYEKRKKSADPNYEHTTAVVIKVLNPIIPRLPPTEWQEEIEYLSGLRHPNVARVVGYSLDDKHKRTIIYEHLNNGSLEDHLFEGSRHHHKDLMAGEPVREALPWETRVHIAIGAARGFEFLHGLNPPVLSRDIKPSNILLDKKFNAKIDDYGLTSGGLTGEKFQEANKHLGILANAAPEYYRTGFATTRSDVYAFGVVLFELLTGRRATVPPRKRKTEGDEEDIVTWVYPYLGHSSTLKRIMDKRLKDQYPPSSALAVACVALQCVAENEEARPPMTQVLQTLLKQHETPNS